MQIPIGQTGHARTTVTETQTAQAVGSGNLPVFGTPMMVALMEAAACDALSGILEPGQTSVGTTVNITHVAATALGGEVTATAEVTAVDGRKISFALSAADGKGPIGHGTHDRFVVDAARFMEKLNG